MIGTELGVYLRQMEQYRVLGMKKEEKDITVTMLFDNSHEYSDGYSKVITVDQGPDSVDFILLLLLNPGDIVVTQDLGV